MSCRFFRAHGNTVSLLRETPSRLPFGKAREEVVPFDAWITERPPAAAAALARILQALGDGETAPDRAPLVTVSAEAVSLHPALVARLTDSEATALGLPPATRLSLDLRSAGLIHRDGFRIDTGWTRSGGVPVRASVTGDRLRHEGREWRVPEPLHSALAHVAAINAASDEAGRHAGLAALKQAIGEDAAAKIATDGVIDRLRLSYASGFSLALNTSAGGFDFDPVLFGRERLDAAADGAAIDEEGDALLPPALAVGFARRFRAGDGARQSYLLDDGSILYIDPQLGRVLKEVRRAQSASPEQRRAFATAPERHIAEALAAPGEAAADAASLFVETQQFSARVAGIDVWRKPVLPWMRLARDEAGRPAVLLRRMKEECVSLPRKVVRAIPLPMPPRQAQAYDRVIHKALAVKGTGQRGRMLEVLAQLRGVSLHPVSPEEAGGDDGYWDDSARLRTVFELLSDISTKGEKALIFCESLAIQSLLAVEIRRRFYLPHEVARIHGGVTGDARQAAVDVFQARGVGFDAMILSPKAGGVGLTLTAANHVVHLSRWWNPAVEDQATDRAYRIGQTRDVFVYLPQAVHPDPALAETSFDLKLHALMERKRTLSRGLFAPAEEESDADALFDAVVTEAAVEPAPAALAPSSPKIEAPPARPRRTLGLRRAVAPAEPLALDTTPVKCWPGRVVYEANGTRDYTIFSAPIADDPVRELIIVDPYAAAGATARAATARFARMLLGDGASATTARLITFAAEDVDTRVAETSDQQYADMQHRWRQTFGDRVDLQFFQQSRRSNRSLHDREVRAVTRSGRTLIWDLGRGIDGVMANRFRCNVTLTEE